MQNKSLHLIVSGQLFRATAFFFCFLLTTCSEPKVLLPETKSSDDLSSGVFTEVDSLRKYFVKNKTVGSFVLFNENENEYLVYNDSFAQQSFCPASTFKIFNALVALETGILKDTTEIIKWDGKDRGWDKWNQDHNLATGMEYSAVWFYQEVARRVHAKDSTAYQTYLDKVEYGNQTIGKDITMFWLDNSLQMTPFQQIDFLRKLYDNDLPFGERTMDMVKDITTIEKGINYTLHAKTGWAIIGEMNIGWYVGYVEKENNVYYFATRIRRIGEIENKSSFRRSYVETGMDILRDLVLNR